MSLRAWWRKWVWVPKDERWVFTVPLLMEWVNLQMMEHYAVHLRAALHTQPLLLSSHRLHLFEHNRILKEEEE